MTLLTISEAHVLLLVDKTCMTSCDVRDVFGTEAAHAWAALVARAHDRIAAEDVATHVESPPAAYRYPGGNEPDFQTLALFASAAGEATAKVRDTEAQALRVGIETIVRAFGTNSAEWSQQLRALLDRVPVTRVPA